jgi:predicted HicB family RNase H-like nuclease
MADYILRYDDELHKRAKIRAVEEGITLKDLIIKALEEYLKASKKKGGK